MQLLLFLVPAVLFFLTLAFKQQGIFGALWSYPALLSFYCMLPERKAWLANVALLCVVLPRAWMVLDSAIALRVMFTLLAVSVISVIFLRVISVQQRQLQTLAVRDALTGLYNRALLHATLEQAVEQSQRSGVPMGLLTLDLDYFKNINDTLGHEAGDQVLRSVGKFLLQRLRRSDSAFRLGGEEFLILLYGTNAENSRRLAEELRDAIANLAILPHYPVTVSIGVAALEAGEDWQTWMKRSDQQLYDAKQKGRNRVAC